MVNVYCDVRGMCSQFLSTTANRITQLRLFISFISTIISSPMQLLYSHFINVCGLPGRNIVADLYMEHLNEGCIKNLGANKTETAIVWSAKALGTIVPILENFDSQSNVKNITGEHKRESTEKDRAVMVEELKKIDVFTVISSRKHPSFPTLRNPLNQKSEAELKSSIMKHTNVVALIV